jgi:hypothetical protein
MTGPISRWEPTLQDLLSEPIIKTLMDVDGVDFEELQTMLQRIAEALQSGSTGPKVELSHVTGLAGSFEDRVAARISTN